MEAEFGFPHYQMHRADVLDALVCALPVERLHVGHRLTALVDHDDHVDATFENGTRISVDALVGADGIHSTVRHVLFGPEKPRFTGCVAYRGLVPADRLSHLDLEVTSQIWMGPGKHFVHYYVQNRRLVNFVAAIEQDTWTRESWTDRVTSPTRSPPTKGGTRKFADSRGSRGDVHMGAVRPQTDGALVGRAGDACSATRATRCFRSWLRVQRKRSRMGLRWRLACRKSPRRTCPKRCAATRTLRLPRTSRVQGLSEANKTRFHLADGPAQQARDAEMARGTTDWSLKAIAWLYGHDAGRPEKQSDRLRARLLRDRWRRGHLQSDRVSGGPERRGPFDFACPIVDVHERRLRGQLRIMGIPAKVQGLGLKAQPRAGRLFLSIDGFAGAALGNHLNEISIARAILKVPAHAELVGSDWNLRRR